MQCHKLSTVQSFQFILQCATPFASHCTLVQRAPLPHAPSCCRANNSASGVPQVTDCTATVSSGIDYNLQIGALGFRGDPTNILPTDVRTVMNAPFYVTE